MNAGYHPILFFFMISSFGIIFGVYFASRIWNIYGQDEVNFLLSLKKKKIGFWKKEKFIFIPSYPSLSLVRLDFIQTSTGDLGIKYAYARVGDSFKENMSH